MDQELISILKSLILPPGGLILLGIISLLFCKKMFGKILLTITLALFYLLSTPFVAANLIAGLERDVFVTPEEIKASNAEAIVVLCGDRYSEAPEYGGNTIKGLLLERVRYAAWLQKRTGLPIIVTGGDIDNQRVPEAQLASKVLKEEFGSTVLATENNSESTWDNAQLTHELLETHGIKKIALVTHVWHMPRAMRVFKMNKVDAIAAPTIFSSGRLSVSSSLKKDWLPSSKAFRESYFALHEHLGMAWYKVRDLANLP